MCVGACDYYDGGRVADQSDLGMAQEMQEGKGRETRRSRKLGRMCVCVCVCVRRRGKKGKGPA